MTYVLECCGICSKLFQRIAMLILEMAQLGLFTYFSGATYTSMIVFGSFFAFQLRMFIIYFETAFFG